MKCIYHSTDLDGKCSAAIVKHKHPEVEIIPYNYGDKIDSTIMQLAKETIFIVDVSLPWGLMVSLDEFNKLVWIDHHEPKIKEAAERGFEPAGIRQVGLAGCELCWGYLFPKTKIPICVKLLGRYDVWDKSDKWEWKNHILPFQWGMKLNNWKPDDYAWASCVFDPDPEAVFIGGTIETGLTCLEFQRQQDGNYCKTAAFEGRFYDLRAVIINKALTSSQTWESIYNSLKHDLMISFYLNKEKRWIVSLYSDKEEIHCGEICKKFGGGGHRGAAGFVADKIPNFGQPY